MLGNVSTGSSMDSMCHAYLQPAASDVAANRISSLLSDRALN
jgi:hypothetical protein